ncbi:CehA/McbA family metallohydrolase [Paenibacillus sp. sptzw28]|uniref:CehA/McbA family metallohydrolase n=1 Tax=Paenibacillus sp. sptzw28 TaxID=715179 RepID=UPI001C6ED2E6|nr:CehA/McbA family metallohydrolase [Paenibacillus sp. sptzw28]QYR19081.1 CehA/McbA family metallohydrolase [Paenibacillus sp. sptzw28]
MRWIACELHTHTFHSDGRQSLHELAEGAKSLGFECIALTDHNTMTGLADRETVERVTGITIIPGMEWTTFYGHMVTIGLSQFVDWRTVGVNDIDQGIAKVHEQGGIAGMAHPFRIGSPICTGCFWKFNIRDWNALDYIEVWSGTFPPVKHANARAFSLWTERLNEGYRIAAVSGRDWHEQSNTEELVSVTYLGIEEGDRPIGERAVHALSKGRTSVTIGPLITLTIEHSQGSYINGDLVPPSDETETVRARVHADFSVRKGVWDIPDQNFKLRIIGNTGLLAEKAIRAEDKEYLMDFLQTGLIWARAELWGTIRHAKVLIAFTNAVYFSNGSRG